MLAKKIQEMYREYERLSIICEAAQDAMLEDFENEELEKIADEAYDAMWAVREPMVQLLMKYFTKGNRQTANAMLASEKMADLMKKKIIA